MIGARDKNYMFYSIVYGEFFHYTMVDGEIKFHQNSIIYFYIIFSVLKMTLSASHL